MKLNGILMLLLIFGIVSCSSGDKKNEGEDSAETAMESGDDADEFGDDMEDSDDSEDEDLFAEDDLEDMSGSSPSVQITGDSGQYTVEKGDTLMLIAFKLYGDYSMWRSLSDNNPGISPASLRAGSTISYNVPSTRFEWSPQGDPYLIKSGDTLGTVSNDKYGTPKKWRAIYENNRPLIKDPNLIFAGFTLYYVPDDRDLASEL